MRPSAFAADGRWYRGNLHTHSDRSDGVAPPEQVLAEYRAAGYDFLVLTDHFEARWGWAVTETGSARDGDFTTLLGAELSSADWDDEDVFWVTPAAPRERSRSPASTAGGQMSRSASGSRRRRSTSRSCAPRTGG